MNFKDKWNEKYQEFTDEGMEDQDAMNAADEYMTEYVADYGDYLYEQEKEKRMMGEE